MSGGHGHDAGHASPENKRIALLIAIVLASASIITGIGALAWIAGGLGLVGIAFSLIGFFAPTAIHLF